MKRLVLAVICAIIFSASTSMAGGPYNSLEDAVGEKARLDKEGTMADDGVILWSADNVYFVVKVKEAKKSETLNSLMEDSGIKDPIPLPNIKGEALRYIVAWLEDKQQFETLKKEIGLKTAIFRDVILAVNFLDIPDALPIFLRVYLQFLNAYLLKIPSKAAYDSFKAEFIDQLPRDLRKLLVKQLLGSWTPIVSVLSVPQKIIAAPPRFSPDSKTILTYSRNFNQKQDRAELWNVAIDRNPLPLKTAELRDADLHEISPKGNWVVSNRASELSQPIKDLLTRFSNPRFGVIPDLSWQAPGVFSPDGTKFLSCTTDPNSPPKAMWSLDPPRQYPKSRYPLGNWCSYAKFIGEETWLLEKVGGPRGSIRLWDAHPEAKGLIARPSAVFEEGQEIKGWEVSPDGKLLAATTSLGTRLWKIEANDNPQPISTITDRSSVLPRVRILAFSPDSKRIVALLGNVDRGRLALFDVSTPQEPRMIASSLMATFDPNEKYDFSPDGRFIAVGSRELHLVLFPNKESKDWIGFSTNLGSEYVRVFDIVFSPDNKWIAIRTATPQFSKIFLLTRDLSQIDLASALIIAWARRIKKAPDRSSIPDDLARSRSDLPEILRQALADDPYADALLYGPQRERGEPELKKAKPSNS